MADYRTLQEAINAGITNMKGDDYSKTIETFPINHYNVRYVGLDVHSYSSGTYRYYGRYNLGDFSKSNSKFVFGSESSWFTLQDEVYYDEHGKINGNLFYKIKLVTSYEDHELFFFPDLMKFYFHCNTSQYGSSQFVAGSQTLSVQYPSDNEIEFTFSCEDKINGLDWSYETGKPDLPIPPEPEPIPTPTIQFTFVNGIKYRARIKTKYKKLNEEKEVYSNYCDEFIGHKIPQRYEMWYGGSIDLSDMSVWDLDYTDKKQELYLEGDYKGFHYKHYITRNGSYINNGITVITGKQTEEFDSYEEWPFNDDSVDPSSQMPAYWGQCLYFDGEITNFGGMFYCNKNRFFNLPGELVFGKNAKFPKITERPFRGISTYPMIFYLDNISDTVFEIESNTSIYLFRDWVYFESTERNDRFISEIKISENTHSISYMFENCNDLEQIDTSKYTSDMIQVASMFNGCYSLTGKIDLRGLHIIGSLSSTFRSCQKVEEILFSDRNEVENLSNAFYRCLALKKIDLSSFSIASGYTSYGVYAKDAFYNCSSLEELDMGNLKIRCNSSSSSYDARNMLYNCTSLKRFVTPSFYGNYRPTLPVAMYDEDDPTDIYEAGETVPANVTLIAVNQ